jgi:hypothetical protein
MTIRIITIKIMTKFTLLALLLLSSLSLPAQLNKQKVCEEVRFLLKKYASSYVDTLRGMTPQQWNERRFCEPCGFFVSLVVKNTFGTGS